ncbi:DUF1961 family protein [Labilibacter marinus]|uniref:DUF1961 family protein n=1 Tax=Labilibacter marinus TaxID=1477105 RepID=UPI000950335D|nr:DUF1961 family protein [Labilibacter marinus]
MKELIILLIVFSVQLGLCKAQKKIEPIFQYNLSNPAKSSEFKTHGEARVLDLKGKKGINPTSIHSRIELLKHNLNKDEKGSMVIWAFFLEELNAAHQTKAMTYDNESWFVYPLISDNKEVSNSEESNFGMYFFAEWHPQFYVKMYKGKLYPTRVDPPQKAFVTSEHFSFKANKWYQLTFTWDKKKEDLRLYANGVLIGTDDKYHNAFHIDEINEKLYTGNPSICYSNIDFYNEELSGEEVAAMYKNEAPDFDQEYIDHLNHVFNGYDVKEFTWKLDNTWTEKLNLKLNEPNLLDTFYVQGYQDAPSVSKDGLLIETPNIPQQGNTIEKQVYMWPLQRFEGDIYIEYEFKPLREGGLSLLMAQSSGMNREDFMKDYPLRTNGNMGTVLAQGVRNYHWEYYREMNDVRNDVASGALVKNPYFYPLSYGSFKDNLENKEWHKLQFLQRGDKIIGAIDGKIIVEGTDNANTNNGPVLNSGYMAIRCMIRTKILFRNLKVYNKNEAFKVVKTQD